MKQMEKECDNKYFILSYNNGAIDINIPIVMRNDGYFVGIDNANDFIIGDFIDNRYLLLYFIKDNKVIRKYIGINAITHISIRLDGTKICTGLHINDMPWEDEEKEELESVISNILASLDENILNTVEEDKEDLINNINDNPKYKERKVVPIAKLQVLM